MDLVSVFSEMLAAAARLWFQVGLRRDYRVHTWYLSLSEHEWKKEDKAEDMSCFMTTVVQCCLTTFMGFLHLFFFSPLKHLVPFPISFFFFF